MTFDEVVDLCKQLEYKDKLRLVQSLSQMIREGEKQAFQSETERGQQPSVLAEDSDKVVQEVARRLMKLKPVKRSSLLNSIVSMFQFQGGISEADTETIVSELQRLQFIRIDKNDKVKYLQKEEAKNVQKKK